MDLFSYVACLLVGVALPIAAFYVGARRAWRQLSAAEAYREVSHELGLVTDTRGISVHGYVGQRRLWIGEVMTGYGAERKTEERGVLGLARPLGLALHLRRRGMRGRFKRRSPELLIGDPDLDKRYEIHGDDLDQVRTVLNAPAVNDAIDALVKSHPKLVITDHAVRVHLSRPETSAVALMGLIRRMEGLAQALEEARKRVAVPSHVVPLVERWEQMAPRLGLDFEPWLPAMYGEIEGRAVLVAVRRVQGGFTISVRVWFHEHPPLGLRLSRQVDPDGYWSVGQDIQVADEAFDKAFVIKGYDPHIVRERLSDEVRRNLLELIELGEVVVDDEALSLRGLEVDHDTLEADVLKMVDTATALGW